MRFAVASVIALGLGLGASATPFEASIEERATASKCTTVASGYMVTSDNAVGLQNGSEPTKYKREYYTSLPLESSACFETVVLIRCCSSSSVLPSFYSEQE